MVDYRKNILKMLALTSFLFISSCDEDYVNSLTTDKPVVYLETNDNLNSLYLGESVEDVELILKVENSPAISQFAFSVDFDSDFLNPDDIIISSEDDNLFYNVNPDGQIYFITEFSETGFEGNIGFSNNNQDTTYTYGDGEIARLYLSGINAYTEFNLSIDEVISYDNFNIDLSDWNINPVFYLGQPIPKIYFSNINYNIDEPASPYLSMFLSVENLPLSTEGEINIDYDESMMFFINETNPEKGGLINDGFDVVVTNEEIGKINFIFKHSDGELDRFINGTGDLVELKFIINNTDFSSQQSPLNIGNFAAEFVESVYDICGDCLNPDYSEYYNYDVNYWNSFDEGLEIHFGCMEPEALNYNDQAIIDDGTCVDR
tara:strand:- start:6441 stop:7565 length:1125 start_codon:yes stop_codon:yes gene_type:complete